MSSRSIILLAIFLLLSFGCSNTRFLTDDQVLYTGQEKVNLVQENEDVKRSTLRSEVQLISTIKPSNSIFDRRVLPPIGLWVYNYWKVDEEKKVGPWIFNRLSKPPVLISDINPALRAQKLQNDLFDQGYFEARAWSVLKPHPKNPKKARVEYFIDIAPPYHYAQIELDTIKRSINALVNQDDLSGQIKPGDQFNLEQLKRTRTQLARHIQNQGYFHFTPDYIELSADTSAGNKEINLLVRRKSEAPPEALSRYSLDSIQVLLSRSSDTDIKYSNTEIFDGLFMHSSGEFLKPAVIRDAVLFNTGDNYSYMAYQQTISRLNNLGVFSYIRISYNISGPDSTQNLLNVRIDLIMSDNINLDIAADLVMKSTGFVGPQLTAEISHTNAFKGAEKIHVGINGGFEWQWGPKQENQLGTFSYELGANTGLTYPRIILPGKKTRIKKIMKQETSINQDFNLLNRTAYYTMVSSLTHLNYSWGKTREITHSYSPLYFNSVSLLATTPNFDSIIDENIYIRRSFEEQFIMGMKYEFRYDNTYLKQPRNIYFQAGISTSGNALDLFAGMGKDPSERPYEFRNNIYSQHLKFTTDLRYYFHRQNNTLAMRMYAGVGIPYLNSDILPYVEQFFSGGAYSIRGFTARTLGPGSFHEEKSTYIDQSGDLKLEANLEYRFGISQILKGALFVDAGNIWLTNEDESRPGSDFKFNTFLGQLAVGTGVGLRFDFNFFVLRADLGIPVRTPYVQDDSNWISGSGNILSSSMFYLAIGYPF